MKYCTTRRLLEEGAGASPNGGARSATDKSLKRQIAVVLERRDRPDIAIRICTCGPTDRDAGVFPCKKPLCCRFCAAVAGYEERRDRAARALLALESNPHLALYFMTLTTHDHHDFEEQVVDIKERLHRLLRKKVGAWSKVRGIMFWVDPARGASGLWRAHIHAIVAFDERDPPRHPRSLVLAWAHEHRSELPKPWSRDHWERDREYRDIVSQQEIQPLHCYRTSALSAHVDATCNPVARLFDVMEVAEYARTDRRRNIYKPGKRHIPLRAEDRVLVTLLGLRLRECRGVFFGVNRDAREALQAQLREIDRSLSHRKQLYTEALRHPSRAASLVPHYQQN